MGFPIDFFEARTLNNETEQKYEDQAQDRQKGLHQSPGFEGVRKVQSKVLFYQPEVGIVYMR